MTEAARAAVVIPPLVEDAPADGPAAVAPAADEVVVWLARLDQPPVPDESLAGWLGDAERARAARFRFERHRRPWMAARGLVRGLLAQAAGIAPADVRFVEGPHGKPALDGGGDLTFNVSHSGDWLLVGLARGRRLGVDVELERPIPELASLMEGLYAPAERRAVLACAPAAREAAFYRLWSQKEACIKATGHGLALDTTGFTAPGVAGAVGGEGDAGDAGLLELPALEDGAHAPFAVRSWRPAPGLHAAVAVEGGAARVRWGRLRALRQATGG